MPDGIAFWDNEEQLIYANKSMQDWQNNAGFEMQPKPKKGPVSNLISKKIIRTEKSASELEEYFKSVKVSGAQRSKSTDIQFFLGDQLQTTAVTEIELKNGDSIQRFSDVSRDRKRAAEIKRVYDALENFPTGAMLWDKEHKLIFANRAAREIQENNGLKMSVGISRIDMVKNSIKNNIFALPNDIKTVEKYVEYSVQMMRENEQGFVFSFSNEKNAFLGTTCF